MDRGRKAWKHLVDSYSSGGVEVYDAVEYVPKKESSSAPTVNFLIIMVVLISALVAYTSYSTGIERESMESRLSKSLLRSELLEDQLKRQTKELAALAKESNETKKYLELWTPLPCQPRSATEVDEIYNRRYK